MPSKSRPRIILASDVVLARTTSNRHHLAAERAEYDFLTPSKSSGLLIAQRLLWRAHTGLECSNGLTWRGEGFSDMVATQEIALSLEMIFLLNLAFWLDLVSSEASLSERDEVLFLVFGVITKSVSPSL